MLEEEGPTLVLLQLVQVGGMVVETAREDLNIEVAAVAEPLI